MSVQFLIVVVTTAALVLIVRAALGASVARRALPVLLLAYGARLLVHVLVLRGSLIHYGGDNFWYEMKAVEVAAYWRNEGFQFVTAEQIPSLSFAAVPCNLFAIVVYLCGGPAPFACTGVVALIACLLCIVMYRFALIVGADERAAFLLLVVTAFMPAFLLHTSDTFKDGLNVLLVVSCLALAASNAQRFDVRRLLALGPLLWALWYVRPYMVAMCAVPLVLSSAVVRRSPLPRPLHIALIVSVLAALFVMSADGGPVEIMQGQLEYGQSEFARRANADGGSGVIFDDGGNAWNAIAPKLLYTLLAPFPWMGGSVVLQLGKVDMLVWYFILYSAFRGGRRLWRDDRAMLVILLLFIVPGLITYATTMANVGLIFRQRMPIVMVTSLLAAVAWSRTRPGRQRNGKDIATQESPDGIGGFASSNLRA
ncbi:hypothetical protein Psi02_25350 [Planotetraspora silvatica]|uniref:Glycosyltransferase RgtA/B/C/D-like domain-containing protein n=1 Tax=Planotetraspora silvatica TaxID=234614 RepID=A0A8J3UMS1_9ACTN|nr:hypothetical protein [Planotetraspora silvatica]GII46111.1 hypothetical protein Psi02_25350 [Planotetraspora silvatica]